MKMFSRKVRKKAPQKQEGSKEPFFSKTNDTSIQKKDEPFFQTKLTIGQPGDKYEQEADSMADAVVNHNNNGGAVQKKEADTIQKVSLATPLEREELSTAEAGMERDKEIQEKPEIQADHEEEEMAQMQEEEEMAQMQEEEEPMQMMGEGEEMAQMQEEEEMAQMQEEEEPMQMMGEEEEMAQMQEEEEMAQMQEEEEPMQMMGEEEEMAQMQEEEELQMKSNTSRNRKATPQLTKQLEDSKGGGNALPDKTKTEMEQAFGVDFSNVNIHTDKNAEQMNKSLRAQAFANGKDIYFNSGKYSPESSAGKHLLAHELTHIVQQNNLKKKSGGGSNPKSSKVSDAPQMVNRLMIDGEDKSPMFIAVKLGLDARFDEVLDILKKLEREQRPNSDLGTLKEEVEALLAAPNTVYVKGEAVTISPTGGRANAHLGHTDVVDYFRKYCKEIAPGKEVSLVVGKGRTEGHGTHGQILYNYAGSEIKYFHAHDHGKMG